MTRYTFLCILLEVLIMLSSSLTISSNSSKSNEIPVGRRYAVVYYGESNDYVTKIVLERNYTIVIAEPYFIIPKEWKKRGIQVYVYIDVLGLWIDKLDWVKKNHPEWLLYTKEGKVAKFWYGQAFMCNIAVKSYQDYLINKAKEYLKRGFTGIFLDDVPLDITKKNPLYDMPVYNETKYGKWIDALILFLKRLKNETGVPILYNTGWGAPSPELMKVLDGALIEFYLSAWRGNPWKNPEYYYRPWHEILKVSLESQKYAEKGKIIITLSYGDKPEIYEYTYATARLFDFYYWISRPIIDRILDAKVLDIDLGNPLERFKYHKCIYYRIYEKGLVAVNPYNERCTVEIQVPSSWSELVRINGEVYTVDNGVLKITLGPQEGMVLLLKKTGKLSRASSIRNSIVKLLKEKASEIASILIALTALIVITVDYQNRRKQSVKYKRIRNANTHISNNY